MDSPGSRKVLEKESEGTGKQPVLGKGGKGEGEERRMDGWDGSREEGRAE